MLGLNNSAEINAGAFFATGTNVVRLFILEKYNNGIFLIFPWEFHCLVYLQRKLGCKTNHFFKDP